MNTIKTTEQCEAWLRRNIKYISLSQICKDAGVSYPSVNHYLKGTTDPVGRAKGSFTKETAEKLIVFINKMIAI